MAKVALITWISSEMFGASTPPQNERTPFWPRSPYGIWKVYSYWMTRNYREAYGMFAVNGSLFNHESPRRGLTFDSLIGDASRAASILGWTSKVMTPRTSADHGRGGLCRCLI